VAVGEDRDGTVEEIEGAAIWTELGKTDTVALTRGFSHRFRKLGGRGSRFGPDARSRRCRGR
jgi:hypothetical protein